MSGRRVSGRRADETGGIALLSVLGGLVLATVGLLLITVVTDLAAAHARAQSAADAAALAAMATSPLVGGAGDAREVAAGLAAANGARLEHCCAADHDATWPFRVRVGVSTRAGLPVVRTLAPPLRAEAVAAVRPRGTSWSVTDRNPRLPWIVETARRTGAGDASGSVARSR